MDMKANSRTHFVSTTVKYFLSKLNDYRNVVSGKLPAKSGLKTSALVAVGTTASDIAIGTTAPDASKTANIVSKIIDLIANGSGIEEYEKKAYTIHAAFFGIEEDTLSLALCEAGVCIFQLLDSISFEKWKDCNVIPNLTKVAVEAIDRIFHFIGEKNAENDKDKKNKKSQFCEDIMEKIGTAEGLLKACFHGESKSWWTKKYCQGISYSNYLEKHLDTSTQTKILLYCQDDKIKMEASEIHKHIFQSKSHEPFSMLRTSIENLTKLVEEQGNKDKENNILIVKMYEMLKKLSISQQSHNGEEKDKLLAKANEVPSESKFSKENGAGVTLNSQEPMLSENASSQEDGGGAVIHSESSGCFAVPPENAFGQKDGSKANTQNCSSVPQENISCQDEELVIHTNASGPSENDSPLQHPGVTLENLTKTSDSKVRHSSQACSEDNQSEKEMTKMQKQIQKQMQAGDRRRGEDQRMTNARVYVSKMIRRDWKSLAREIDLALSQRYNSRICENVESLIDDLEERRGLKCKLHELFYIWEELDEERSCQKILRSLEDMRKLGIKAAVENAITGLTDEDGIRIAEKVLVERIGDNWKNLGRDLIPEPYSDYVVNNIDQGYSKTIGKDMLDTWEKITFRNKTPLLACQLLEEAVTDIPSHRILRDIPEFRDLTERNAKKSYKKIKQKLAIMIGTNWRDFGEFLYDNVEDMDVNSILDDHKKYSSLQDKCIAVFKTWKDSVPQEQYNIGVLIQALRNCRHVGLAEYLSNCTRSLDDTQDGSADKVPNSLGWSGSQCPDCVCSLR